VARSEAPLEKLRSEYPEQVRVLAGDLADFTLGQKAVDIAKSTWNQLDGLIINHGVLDPVKRIADSEAEAWRSAFDINVFSAVAMVCFLYANREYSYNKVLRSNQHSRRYVNPRARLF
jgi:NADP-dependent 3-hydroxy acid dehydrogenase YdfG